MYPGPYNQPVAETREEPVILVLVYVSLHSSLHCKEEVNTNTHAKLNSIRSYGFLVGILQK